MTPPRPPQQPPFPPPRGPSGTPWMMQAPPLPPERPSVFRRTLVKVMVMQVVALVLLWLLQVRYTP